MIAIILIIFALSLIGIGGYRIYTNFFNKEVEEEITEKPEIAVEFDEETGIINVSVTHTKAVEGVVYSWNKGHTH